jgi:protein-L-isoaspartate(D-aspartate) O-methyltransferase
MTGGPLADAGRATDFAIARDRMVAEQLRGRGIRDPRVLDAMARIPRHRFVQEALVGRAYGDIPLPIGDGQTISQPYMVALMSEALGLRGGERVLEIGTGSGYQTAVLAELAGKVYSVERVRSLAERARQLLGELGYYNIRVRVGDGSLGWADEAPFDAILVAAGAPAIPAALAAQLGEGGRLVAPVGSPDSQTLRRAVRRRGGMVIEDLIGCVFVRLVGAAGWPANGE